MKITLNICAPTVIQKETNKPVRMPQMAPMELAKGTKRPRVKMPRSGPPIAPNNARAADKIPPMRDATHVNAITTTPNRATKALEKEAAEASLISGSK